MKRKKVSPEWRAMFSELGKRSAKARMKATTADERSAQAQKAAAARWEGHESARQAKARAEKESV